MADLDLIILQRAGAVWTERTITSTPNDLLGFDGAGLLTALPGVGTMASQDADAVAIIGGTIDAVSLLRVDNGASTAKTLKAGLLGTNGNRVGSFPAVGMGLVVIPNIDLHIASNYGASDNTGIYVDSFGGSFAAIFVGRGAGGTFAAPTAALTNYILALFGGRAYNGAAFSTINNGSMQVIATETQTAGHGGAKLEFWTTANTTITPAKALTIDQDKTVLLEAGIRVGSVGNLIDNIISATAALDFGSINAAASADLTIAVTGAEVGDSVTLGLPAAPTAGIIFQAFVSSGDTVTVRATNITGSPIDPASATYRATVFNY